MKRQFLLTITFFWCISSSFAKTFLLIIEDPSMKSMRDGDRMESIFRNTLPSLIASDLTTLRAEFSTQGVFQKVDSLKGVLNPREDVLIVVYSGHGFNDKNQKSEYPSLAFRGYQDYVSSDSIVNTIKDKARLALFFFDCCNEVRDPKAITWSSRSEKKEHDIQMRAPSNRLNLDVYNKIFANTKGYIVCSSASKGEKAYGDGAQAIRPGTFFVKEFAWTWNNYLLKATTSTASWETFLQTIKTRTANYVKKLGQSSPEIFVGISPDSIFQTPQYKGIINGREIGSGSSRACVMVHAKDVVKDYYRILQIVVDGQHPHGRRQSALKEIEKKLDPKFTTEVSSINHSRKSRMKYEQYTKRLYRYIIKNTYDDIAISISDVQLIAFDKAKNIGKFRVTQSFVGCKNGKVKYTDETIKIYHFRVDYDQSGVNLRGFEDITTNSCHCTLVRVNVEDTNPSYASCN